MRHHLWISGLILFSFAAAHGQPIEAVPHTFQADAPARAAEVNANFEALVAEAQRLEAALGALRGDLPADLAARLDAAEGRIGALEMALAERDAQIAALQGALDESQVAAQAALEAARDRLDGVDDVLSASIDAAAARLDAVEGQLAGAEADRGTLSDRADAADGRLDAAEGRLDAVRDGQLQQDAQLADLRDDVDEVLNREDLPQNILTVATNGAADTFGSVQAAMDYLADYRIRPGRLVQIRVQPGVYVSGEPLVIDHPDSERIQLRGQGDDPTQVRLVFNGTDGLSLAAGHTFQVQDVTFDGEPVDGGGRGRRGAVVADHAVLVLQTGVTFTRFGFGLQIDSGGIVRGSRGGRIVSNDGAGVTLSDGAFLDLPEAEISRNGGEGVACPRRCYLALNSARIEGNDASGIIMADGAVADLSNATIDSNTQFGVLAERGSIVNLSNATVQRSGFAGVQVASMSWGNVSQATVSGNNTRDLGTQAQLVAKTTAYLAISNGTDLDGNDPLTRPAIDNPVALSPISVDND